jgi:hypothetical protein
LQGQKGDTGLQGPPGPAYWNEITLASDFNNATATFNTITGMTFTPTANSPFEVQAALLIQTATATNLPRIGVNVGAGQAYGAVQIDQTGATVTARVMADGTFTTAAVNVQVAAGGLPTANAPYLCYVTIRGKAGASPGAISLQMACETAAANMCFACATAWLSRKGYVEVKLVGGRDRRKWLGELDRRIGAAAAEAGATRLTAIGRRGWLRELKRLGWEGIGTVDGSTVYQRQLG